MALIGLILLACLFGTEGQMQWKTSNYYSGIHSNDYWENDLNDYPHFNQYYDWYYSSYIPYFYYSNYPYRYQSI
jgi:hypothetical protein